MASVDGGAHTVAVSFQDHDITRRIGMAGERTCVVYRAIVDDHGQVHHLRKAGQHGLDVFLFVASGMTTPRSRPWCMISPCRWPTSTYA